VTGFVGCIQAPVVAPLCARGNLLVEQPGQQGATVLRPHERVSAIIYQPLAQALPQPYARYSVARPGHDCDSSAESLQSVDEVARRGAQEIRASLHGPIALYGHCAGVAIAVAITRRLEAAGATVEAVFLGGALPGTAGRQRLAGGFTKFSTKPRPVGAADLLVHLCSLGGFIEIADPEELNFALRGYLHDDADAAQYFGRRRERAPPRKLTAPIIGLMGGHGCAHTKSGRREARPCGQI
jgi:surfactin synthase thioesterase subunit